MMELVERVARETFRKIIRDAAVGYCMVPDTIAQGAADAIMAHLAAMQPEPAGGESVTDARAEVEREVVAQQAADMAKLDAVASDLQSLCDQQAARIAALEGALIEEREENLWNSYHTGYVKDGRWTHMFMSDGESLARACGFDPRLPDYDDAEIRAAIPVIARAALQSEDRTDG